MCAKKKSSRIATKAKITGLLLLVTLLALLVAQFVPAVRTALAAYFPFLQSDRPVLEVTGNLDVHYIDVGQGDAILIITPEKKTARWSSNTI